MKDFEICLSNHFNPRPPWGGRHSTYALNNSINAISIHALRGEGDYSDELEVVDSLNISIHALRGEGDCR